MDTSDPAEMRRQLNHRRFLWHEAILRDKDIKRYPTALALAGHIMHRFVPENGCAMLSDHSAAKALNQNERSIARAKKNLVDAGWIRLKDAYDWSAKGWSANSYILMGGPNDLLLSQEEGE
jgi:hypothetical protein